MNEQTLFCVKIVERIRVSFAHCAVVLLVVLMVAALKVRMTPSFSTDASF
jgi:hypothetical protein